jgi:hypothetical protein
VRSNAVNQFWDVPHLPPGYERKAAEQLWLEDEGNIDVLDDHIYAQKWGR